MHAPKLALTAAALAALGIATAAAQQPAPPPPAFSPSDLSPAGVRALAATCSGCHGTDGKAVVMADDDLSLAGSSVERLQTRMLEFRSGKRKATLMHQLSKGYSDAEIAALAEYFSKMRD